MMTGCVLFEARPGFLNIIYTSFSFKGLIIVSQITLLFICFLFSLAIKWLTKM
jgi:hypothetical protein